MLSRLSLRYRIALIIFLLEACMLTAVLGVTLTQSRQTTIEFNAASNQASLELLSNLSATALLTSEYSDYQLYITDVVKQPTLRRIVLADRYGKVVAGSDVADVGKGMGDVVKTTGMGWQTQPVVTAAGKLGTLAAQFSDAGLRKAHERTRDLAVAIAIAGMLIVAFAGLTIGAALTRGLELLTKTVRRFAGGDRAARSVVTGRDEVALLAQDFNRMADVIEGQKEYVSLLFDATPEAIYGTDLNGICTIVNPACLRMLGYEKGSELIGRSIHELIHHARPDGRAYPKEQCKVCLAPLRGEVAHGDDEVLWRADGTSFPVEYWSNPMYRGSEMIGVVVIFNDVTERREAERKIRRLTQFYAALSQCNEAIVRCTSEKELFQSICRIVVECAGMKAAWIGRVDPDTSMIPVAASFGDHAEEYLQGLPITTDGGSQLGRGPTGPGRPGEPSGVEPGFPDQPDDAAMA